MKLALAEHFHSIQGEGYWTGTPMHFVRMAGCSVGRPGSLRPELTAVREGFFGVGATPTLSTGRAAWLCHRWDGTPFWCDTDFNKAEEVELDELLNETWENHICLTGGEPLMHAEAVTNLFIGCLKRGIKLHIETSETIPIPQASWVTVSPKQGWLSETIERANELKLLVDENTSDLFPPEFLAHNRVYLSPINSVDKLNQASLARCLYLLKRRPNWKLSVQLHKYLGVR